MRTTFETTAHGVVVIGSLPVSAMGAIDLFLGGPAAAKKAVILTGLAGPLSRAMRENVVMVVARDAEAAAAWEAEVASASFAEASGPGVRDRAVRWRVGPDTGLSSQAMWWTLADEETRRAFGRAPDPWDERAYPRDPGDLGRCLRLLEAVPEWRERLPEVAALSPEWAALVSEWDHLAALYAEELPGVRCPRTYAAMKRARGEAT